MGQDKFLRSLRSLLLRLRSLLLLLRQNRPLLHSLLHSVRSALLRTHSFRSGSAYHQGRDRSWDGRT
jgi:hypothetical protein